jgi:hypothetical protein
MEVLPGGVRPLLPGVVLALHQADRAQQASRLHVLRIGHLAIILTPKLTDPRSIYLHWTYITYISGVFGIRIRSVRIRIQTTIALRIQNRTMLPASIKKYDKFLTLIALDETTGICLDKNMSRCVNFLLNFAHYLDPDPLFMHHSGSTQAY